MFFEKIISLRTSFSSDHFVFSAKAIYGWIVIHKMYRIQMNQNGGFYVKGEAYDETKYLEIISVYKEQERIHGSCSIRKLAKEANISTSTAKKALTFLEDGIITMKPKGRPKSGIGSNHGLTDKDHMFIYELYLDNPSRPVEDYCFKFWRKTGKIVSSSFISSWFQSIGPYKGSLRLMSMYPPKKYTDRNIQCLREYLELLEIFDDHNDFVFASEKPMSETDIYGRVRRDIFTEANVIPRYNVLTAVTTKRKVEQNVEAVVLDTVGDSIFFQSFVLHLMQIKFLVPGDILVVNNCSIHKKGRKEYIVETLWECGILIVPLPPFTPELNPTELAFDEMTARIKASRSRSILALVDFAEVVKEEFDNMSRRDVKKFYRRCDYDI